MDNKHESYVSLETAKLLKEKGFDWECKSLYCTDVRYKGRSIDEDEEYELKAEGNGSKIEYVDGGMICDIYNTNNSGFVGYSRPPLAIAQRWLREIHKIHFEIAYEAHPGCKKYGYSVYIIKHVNYISKIYAGWDTTYEDALESAIKYCLENIIKED